MVTWSPEARWMLRAEGAAASTLGRYEADYPACAVKQFCYGADLSAGERVHPLGGRAGHSIRDLVDQSRRALRYQKLRRLHSRRRASGASRRAFVGHCNATAREYQRTFQPIFVQPCRRHWESQRSGGETTLKVIQKVFCYSSESWPLRRYRVSY